MPDAIIDGQGSGISMTVNSEGRADVVQHAHPNNGWIHFEVDGLTASQDFIVIDLSDTTNYPHDSTGYLHIENLRIHTDSNNQGDYEIQIGFLDDVDATNGDFYVVADLDGSKTIGRSQDIVLPYYPNGPRLRTQSVAVSYKSLNDTAFQTDVNLASTLDTATTDTPSGSGDMVVRIIINGGTVTVGMELSYHSHA